MKFAITQKKLHQTKASFQGQTIRDQHEPICSILSLFYSHQFPTGTMEELQILGLMPRTDVTVNEACTQIPKQKILGLGISISIYNPRTIASVSLDDEFESLTNLYPHLFLYHQLCNLFLLLKNHLFLHNKYYPLKFLILTGSIIRFNRRYMNTQTL